MTTAQHIFNLPGMNRRSFLAATWTYAAQFRTDQKKSACRLRCWESAAKTAKVRKFNEILRKLLFKLIICKSFKLVSSIQWLSLSISLSLSPVMRAPPFIPPLWARGTVPVLLLWLQGKVSERNLNGQTVWEGAREQRNGTDAIKWKLDYRSSHSKERNENNACFERCGYRQLIHHDVPSFEWVLYVAWKKTTEKREHCVDAKTMFLFSCQFRQRFVFFAFFLVVVDGWTSEFYYSMLEWAGLCAHTFSKGI